MTFKVTQKTIVNNGQSVQSNNSNVSSTNSTTVRFNIDAQLQERIEMMGFTSVKEYFDFCENYKVAEFANLSLKEQTQIVADWRIAQASDKARANETIASAETDSKVTAAYTQAIVQNLSKEINTSTTISSETPVINATPNPVEIQEFDSFQYDGTSFNFNEFNTLEYEKQEALFFEKYAKNKFLYGDSNQKRTEEDWNNLSNDERKALISQSTSLINNQFESDNFNEKNLATFLFIKMEELQIANHNKISFNKYNELSDKEKQDYRLAFLQSAYISEDDENFCEVTNTLDPSQREEIESLREITQGLKLLLDQHKEELGDLEYNGKPLTTLFVGENPALTEAKIEDILKIANKKLGLKKEDRLDTYDLHYNYLTTIYNPNDPKSLTENQKNRLMDLADLKETNCYKTHRRDLYKTPPKTNHLETAFANNPQFYEVWNNAPDSTKCIILAQFLDEKLKDVSDPKEKAKYHADILKELTWLGVDLNSTLEEQRDTKVANSSLVNKIGKFLRLRMTPEERIEFANIKDIHTHSIAADMTKDGQTSVEEGHALQATQETLFETAHSDEEREAIVNASITVMDNVSDEVNVALSKGYASWDSVDIQKHHADVAMNMLTRSKEQANEMLSNMSQYSSEETLKYAADQIQNLDKSVQQEALNHIYESGNQAAIDTAIKNLTNAPQVIQEAELPRVFTEATLNSVDLSDPEIANLDFTKRLTTEQLASLSPSQKRAYYANLFVQASANDKIKILEKMPNGNQKKTIFTIIARFVPRLLENMVESGMGLQMLSSNLPMDASNKVLKTMLKSENPDVKKQVAEIRKDKNYAERLENMETSIDEQHNTKNINRNNTTTNYMSTPADLAKTLGLTPEDVANIKTMYARYIQGGFKA